MCNILNLKKSYKLIQVKHSTITTTANISNKYEQRNTSYIDCEYLQQKN